MDRQYVLVKVDGDHATVTLNRPDRRNALSLEVMEELIDAFDEVGGSEARGIVLAANGPVFSAGHDFADMAGADLVFMRRLLDTCTRLMTQVQSVPQPVIARVHALATAAGCQLVASCDLALASEEAAFAIPGGKGGWFCTTPLVAVARNIGRKRALEMAFTGDTVDAATAAEWGLVNRAVPAAELDEATDDLLRRATRGSALSKAIGKQSFYAQIDLDQHKAYVYATEVMASASQTHDAQEGMQSFLQKRPPSFENR